MVVRAAPAFPAPKMPNAVPCRSREYQTEVKAMPMEKLTPAKPKPKLQRAKLVKLSALDNRYMGIAQISSRLP